ncbi:MAG: Dabb family protein [Bacteroidales bacterium]|jgi:hypothetical protein|nr:Dabb family protein [Bacteroidales bacterium]MBP5134804.1 Dabb family protein [Paludibacteraceae bacterium]MBR6310407.1 Dabb family protein [Paludibacteraceae bacterium]MDD6357805.1 Dabb family protein [Bacteroidales bacterium]
MIKHIVLFKLKNFQSEAEKAEKMNEIKVKLEALKSKIDFLRDIRVDICCNPKEEFDLCLDSTVDNMDDLAAYAGHPEHVAVLKIIREVLEKRACVDYEF